jgi:hypothetical protein
MVGKEVDEMIELTGMFVLIGLAFLRLGVPILVIWLLGKVLSTLLPRQPGARLR